MVVQHSQLVADPYGAVRKLHADLVAAGVAGLTVPTETQVTRLIRPSAEKPRAYLASERTMVGEKAAAISAALSAAALPAEKPSTGHRHVARRRAQGQAGDRDAAHDGQQGLPPRRARARLVGPLV